jgi:(1->4)-alpha-D-glucan 1-alpha-D-glucosylmutase
MGVPDTAHRHVTATYRLQMGPAFTFDDAVAAVPGIAALAVSHLYLSPIWECIAGSSHGYDVVDHAAVRREIGGMAGLLRLREAATAKRLGIIVDIVPNHVGVAGALHPWWRDVLRFGERSPYAPFFDIDWHGQPQLRPGVLVVPALGRPFGAALEDGDLALAFDGEEIVCRYFEHSFPIAPACWPAILGAPPAGAAESLNDAASYPAFIDAVDALGRADVDASRALLSRAARLLEAEPTLRSWVGQRLATFSGTPGEPATWDDLDDLLQRQHYRLAYWRVSGEEINYRRFFDINDLAALRQENVAVFEATHALLSRLVQDGVVDGIRVDHVDGLYDPAAYLESLAAACPGVPIWVEKILAHEEPLPQWPIAGTTGYEFLAMAGGLFVDPASERALTAAYREFTGEREPFAAVAADARLQVAESSFAGEIGVLAAELFRLAQRDRRYRDVTLAAFREALAATLAAFPIYRMYLDGGEPRDGDHDLVTQATERAAGLRPSIPPTALEFLARVLLFNSDRLTGEERARWARFRRRFQQMSSPIMAKGVEDTSFFRYNRLLALNEVGAHPDAYGTIPAEFHAWAEERAGTWPLALSATSTHDTKRSEDARMRLAVLSEMPAAWRREVRSWSRLNRRHVSAGPSGEPWPGANTEYYLYQSLVATLENEAGSDYAERIVQHMTKAVREAKTDSSWAEPGQPFEEALGAFVRAILDPGRSRRFLARIQAWVDRIAPAAAVNSLALLTLKCTAPGVPDIYQGTELPFLALTDPDNRRQPDFQALAAATRRAGTRRPPSAEFAQAKPWLLRRLLQLRREWGGPLQGGDYRPLEVEGPHREHALAFARLADGEAVAVVIPRLVAARMDAEGRLALAPGTSLRLPAGFKWREAISGRAHRGATADLAALLRAFPVAVFAGEARP